MERILTLRGNISKRDYQQMLDLFEADFRQDFGLTILNGNI